MKKFRFKTAMLRTALLTCAFASSVMGAKANDFTYNGIKYSTTGTNTAEVANQGGNVTETGWIFKRIQYTYNQTLNGRIEIPSQVSDGNHTYTVTGLAGGAFMCCKNITSVKLPSTITRIGTRTIYVEADGNNGLTHTQNYTGSGAFFNCESLQSVELDSCHFNSTKGAMFAGCPALSHVTLPTELDSLPSFDFIYCSSLNTLDLSNTQLTYIGDYSFHQKNNSSGLSYLYLPPTVSYIGTSAFYKNNLQRITDLGNTNTPPSDLTGKPYLTSNSNLYNVSHLGGVRYTLIPQHYNLTLFISS